MSSPLHESSTPILHVAQPTTGGVCVYLSQLVEEQVARGWPVAVACPGGELAVRARDAGAEVLRWDAVRSPDHRSVAETLRLHALVRSVAPPLVHLHSAKAGLAGRLALRGRLPTVFQPHGWSFEAVEGAAERAAVLWERVAARWADAVLCVSAGERDRGKSLGIAAAWRVVPTGVDVVALRPRTADERREARLALGLPSGPLAVFLGRLDRAKGPDLLLNAWPRVASRVPGALLAIVGDGPLSAALRPRASASVRFTGHRDDAAEWLAAADVVVAPSRWEGMSVAMLEAMASGRSVVTTDVPGALEALGGGCGAVVRQGDPDAFADAVVRRLLDPTLADQEGRCARQRAEERFDRRITHAAIASIYSELLALSAPRPVAPAPTASGATRP